MFYDHKLAQVHGLHNYSGTRADRKYWSQDTMDAEKEILRIKAHEKQISSVTQSRGPPRNASSAAYQDGNLTELSAKTKCNKRQRQLYNKRRKAKKAQQKAQINQKQNANSQAPAPAGTTIKSDP